MNENVINAIIELANYIVDYKQSILYSTTFVSQENKEIILKHFSKENREETIKEINKK